MTGTFAKPGLNYYCKFTSKPIQGGAEGDDAGGVDVVMGNVVVAFDVVHVDGGRDAG